MIEHESHENPRRTRKRRKYEGYATIERKRCHERSANCEATYKKLGTPLNEHVAPIQPRNILMYQRPRLFLAEMAMMLNL
jgi:hypothetical protein